MLRAVVVVVLIGAIAACGARSEAGTLQSALDQQLAANAQRHGVAGQAVLILRDGKPLYRGAHGFADRDAKRAARPDDVFAVYSLAKLFSSVLLMQLVERGELELARPAGQYLPDLPEPWRAIKVEELLNHASGLPDYFHGPATVFPATRAAMFQALAGTPMLFEPGTKTQYVSTNFVILGAILEAHYKMPYRQIVTERIVQPLGLRHTYFGTRHVPQGVAIGSYRGTDGRLEADPAHAWPEYAIVHGELYSNVDDLGAYLNALCEGRLVKPETLLRLWRPFRLRTGETGWPASGWEYGTGDGYKQIGHDGGTKVRARLMFEDALDRNTYAVIYLTNGSAANVWSSTLIDSVMEIVYKRARAR